MIKELTKKIKAFRDERDWEQFHKLKIYRRDIGFISFKITLKHTSIGFTKLRTYPEDKQ